MSPLPSDLGQFTMPTPQLGGMFGGGSRLQNALMAAAAGYMARRNPGQSQSMMGILQEKQSLNRQAQLAMLRDNLEFQRQMELARQAAILKQLYPDDALSQHIRLSGKPLDSPEAQALYGQAAQNEANPFQALDVTNPDGSQTRTYTRAPMLPAAPVGKLTPLGAGGPTQPASGGFLGSGY